MQVTSTPAGLGWDNPVPPADPQPQEQAQPQPEPAAPATTTLGALMHPGQPLPTGNGNPWQGFETSQHKPQPSPLLDYPPDTAIALQLKPLLQEHAQPEADTPTEATTPAPPSADPMEIAALELLLAEPAAQELIQHFGGDLQPPPSGHAVADSIIARYGSDLASRLNQLQSAQQEVQKQYLATLDAAIATPGPQQPGSIFTPDTGLGDVPEHLIALPSRPGQQQGQQGSWTLDPVAFTSAWAQGDSPLQRAYAHLHGAEGMQRVTFDAGTEYETTHWMLAGQKLHLATQRSGDADHDTAQSKLTDGWDRIDLERPPKLIDNDLVWFDPERGWVTDRKNLKPDGIDRAMPIVFGAAMSFMSMGAASAAMGLGAATSCTAAGATATTIGQSAILGAVGGATNQVVNMIGGGRFSFRQVLISAVSGGVAAGVTQLSGLGQMLQSGDTATRLLGHAGRAGLQGAIQQASGGRFADGFINSAMGSVASEVTQNLNSQIAQMEQQGLGASESSLLRLFSRAAGSALRIVGSNDPAAGFASDFLAGALAQATPADAQGETVADNGQATEGGARDTGQGPAPAAPASVTVAAGDTLERLARQQYGEHWRAGLTAMVADNPGIAANQWGSPIIQPGQTLNIPSLDGLSAEQLSHYGQLGGRIVAGNTQGLNVRAELLAAREAQQSAVQASGPATMSQDEAYARYMAEGGRSRGYAQEMGDQYTPTWHEGSESLPGRTTTDSIRPPQGYLADVQAIANSDLSWSDKVRMIRDTTSYYYQITPGFQGAVQMAGGALEVAGGVGLSALPGGAVPGTVAILHGADTFVTGVQRVGEERNVNTVTYNLVYEATGSDRWADAVDRGVPFFTGVAGGAGTINAANNIGKIPHGFEGNRGFRTFGVYIQGSLDDAGYSGVNPILQGSAVTGRSFSTGAAFDVGRISDFDVALASPSLFGRARELGIGLRQGKTRTGPLTQEDLGRLGLSDMANLLRRQYGRDVNFMIYESAPGATARSPSLLIPMR
ncbi:MAG: LysM peptidoglycan-binding domain-containing protein [Ottowia sp.]|uniref:LysM peptidoglycan-binding domain-containing protein n=1 Tax=Ottowia sp. TaxID=1898956 RepID=UPI0039E2180A